MKAPKLSQWLWFIGLWAGGVVTLALIGGAIKIFL